MKFKYVGAGPDRPAKINFMGKVKFKLNKSTDVTDPKIIAKLQGNKCFKEVKVKAVETTVAKKAAVQEVAKKAPAKRRGRPPVGNQGGS